MGQSFQKNLKHRGIVITQLVSPFGNPVGAIAAAKRVITFAPEIEVSSRSRGRLTGVLKTIQERTMSTHTNSVARKASVDVIPTENAVLVNVCGLIDEQFTGFGDVGDARIAIINVSGLTRITSFGIQQWLRAMENIPKSIDEIYLVGCPVIIVDQLNMILNFGGSSRVLSVAAPFICRSCASESEQIVDVVSERAGNGKLRDRSCPKCKNKLDFDGLVESYFSFAKRYAATNISPMARQVLSSQNLYPVPNSLRASSSA